MFLFEAVATPDPIGVVDIGAMILDGEKDPFARLGAMGLLSVVGFEPQLAECKKLNALAPPGRLYLPYAVANGERRTFYVTNSGMTSSLLPPNLELAERFNALAELMQVVATHEIDTVRLDDVKEIQERGCDFLKLDTQGSEAEIIANAQKTLSKCLLVQTEVEFIPIYKNQPLFAEVDQLLRGNGFMFHRFSHIHGRTYKPLMANDNPALMLSQPIWTDAVYVPDLNRLDDLNPRDLIKLAALLHELYGSFDLCHVVLTAHDKQTGLSYASRYIQLLARQQKSGAK